MILSVSRRTDIPAFYSEWFMNRLRAGFVYVQNPMNAHQISKIPLSPNNVDCIVFWTKDPKKLIKNLDEIDRMGYKYYFQFTITPYGKEIEENLPDKKQIIETFKELSEKIGKNKVILRYDPIFLTTTGKYSMEFHKIAFDRIIEHLHSYTNRIVISFLDGYRKVAKNMEGIAVQEITNVEMIEIAESFSITTKKYNLQLETCAEEIPLEQFGINHSKCIDGDLIEEIIGSPIKNKGIKDANRLYCGCMKCIDIGQYDTCIHNCKYCYANINKNKALINRKSHNPKSPLQVGDFKEGNVQERKEGTESFKNAQMEFRF